MMWYIISIRTDNLLILAKNKKLYSTIVLHLLSIKKNKSDLLNSNVNAKNKNANKEHSWLKEEKRLRENEKKLERQQEKQQKKNN